MNSWSSNNTNFKKTLDLPTFFCFYGTKMERKQKMERISSQRSFQVSYTNPIDIDTNSYNHI